MWPSLEQFMAYPFYMSMFILAVLAGYVVWPALIIGAFVCAGFRTARGQFKKGVAIPCAKAILTGLAAVVIFLTLAYGLTYYHVLPQSIHEISLPDRDVSPRPDHYRETFRTNSILEVQAVPLFVAGLLITIIRGRHNKAAGLATGVLLIAIDVPFVITEWAPTKAMGLVYYVLFPLLASSLQWWPQRLKKDPSHQFFAVSPL